MKLNEIYLVSHKRTHLSELELAKLKRCPDYTFPEDLSDFLLKFGPGEYCGCYYIFKPEDLLNGQATCREVWSESFFYDRDKSALSEQEVLQTTWVGRTLDGDEVVYQPTGQVGFYVLPRHSDVILRIGNNFDEVLDWFSSSRVLYRPSQVKWFCTFEDRCRLHLVKDEVIVHSEALALVNETLGVEHLDVDQAQDSSIFFCPKISGFVYVYTDNLDIHHDLDFDSEVCRTVEEKFYRLGFRSVEHYRP